MKKKILTIIFISLCILILKLLYNIGANKMLISEYNNGNYDVKQAKALTYFNLFQGYVANYNYGNVLYQNGEYDEAIEEYEKALNSGNIPKYKECNIRINYALAACNTIVLDEKDQDSIENAINIYEQAIEILTEKGCANKNDNNGHNKKAEELKEDIQKEIDRLKNLQQNETESSEDEEKENKKEKEKDPIESKMQSIKENAIKTQREAEKFNNDYNKEYNMNGKNW